MAATVLLANAIGAFAEPPAASPVDVPATDFDGAFVGSGEAGTGTVGVRFGYYDDEDSGDGNPFLDEEASVIETILLVDYNVTDRLAGWAMFSLDIVTSASIGRLDDYPLQSGASGDYYFGVDTGASYEVSQDTRVGGFLSGSFERDYFSGGIGSKVSLDFQNDNVTVDVSGNYFFDTIEIIRFDGSQDEGTDERHSVTSTVMVRQTLDAKTFGEIGGTFSYQRGLLETPYNGVVVREPGTEPPFAFDNGAEGFEIREAFPNERKRGALFGRVRRSLTKEIAAELSGRYAFDSWDADGFSIEPALYVELLPDVLLARLHYRYYDQDASQYYDLSLDADRARPRYRTQDSDYGSFETHGVGTRLDWTLSSKIRIDFAMDYTNRSDGLDYFFGSVGATYSFTAPRSWLLDD